MLDEDTVSTRESHFYLFRRLSGVMLLVPPADDDFSNIYVVERTTFASEGG
jgi:hypothetical protein